jgi:hypothetical protein
MKLKKLKKKLKKWSREAWDRMGDTGDEGYEQRATPDQLHYAGRYRALEDVMDFLERKKCG